MAAWPKATDCDWQEGLHLWSAGEAPGSPPLWGKNWSLLHRERAQLSCKFLLGLEGGAGRASPGQGPSSSPSPDPGGSQHLLPSDSHLGGVSDS